MTIELVNGATGRISMINAKSFGRLLHLARLHGWQPQKAPQDWPEATWNTQILLPYVGMYMPGPVSAGEAHGLKQALVKASATGQTAVEGGLQLAADVLLQVALCGAFEVRCGTEAPLVEAV